MAVVLPEFYYLDHFTDLARALDGHCRHLLAPEHAEFLREFWALPRAAQCLFVRMINRKGLIFKIDDLRYKEIENFEDALARLRQLGWAREPGACDGAALLDFMNASQLRQLLVEGGREPAKSLKKADLKAWLERDAELVDPGRFRDDLVVQEKAELIEYLYFLYFGQMQSDLVLYTLSDLGIRKAKEDRGFKPRFETFAQAQAEFFQAREHQRIKRAVRDGSELPSLEHLSTWPRPLSASARALHDDALLLWAGALEKAGDGPGALRVLEHSVGSGNTERRVRLLFKNGDKERALQMSRDLLANPGSESQRLFARDFLDRKNGKKKTSLATDLLKEAPVLALEDAYFRQPERGVRDWYRAQGHTAHYAENFLWAALFGLFFWHELFESEKSQIFNRFERRPSDLIGGEFLANHRAEIEAKLSSLTSSAQVLKLILHTLAQKYGTKNEIFMWHPSIAALLTDFLKHAEISSVVKMLRVLAQGFDERSSGYPDLLIVEKGEVRFVEVKAEGDKLHAKQVAALEVLKEAGFRAEVCRVEWRRSTEQSYVVVDVETTGGRAGLHRVTEIGAVKIREGRVVGEFQTLLNPERSIPRAIQHLTGISNEMVKDAPLFQEIADEFEAFLQGAIFVAHNVAFDYGFIKAEFERTGRSFVKPKACTVAGMRRAYPGLASYSLKNLCRHFAIPLDSHHRALCDARAAAELFLLMDLSKKDLSRDRSVKKNPPLENCRVPTSPV